MLHGLSNSTINENSTQQMIYELHDGVDVQYLLL